MKMSDKMYDTLKWICLIALPAFGAFYLTLSKIWGLPMGEEVLGTLSAIEVLLGALLQISNANYKKQNAVQG